MVGVRILDTKSSTGSGWDAGYKMRLSILDI